MTNSILLQIQETLVPIVAVVTVFSVPIIAIYLYYRQKGREMDERKLMIEKGLTPPPMQTYDATKWEKGHTSSNPALVKGLNFLAVSLGIFVGFLVADFFAISNLFAIGGGILFFLGISNIVQSLLINNEPTHDK
jgi:hypothetical protein